MKLSKPQIRAHEQACRLLEKDKLSYDDKLFVIDNWQESANHVNSSMGAFFTPYDLAREINLAIRYEHN